MGFEHRLFDDEGFYCLECGRGYDLDPFHFDCTGQYECTEQEFAWVVGLTQMIRSQVHCDQSHQLVVRSWAGRQCPSCKAAV